MSRYNKPKYFKPQEKVYRVEEKKDNIKIYDTSTIYCNSGVATPSQISSCLKKAISEAEKILGYDTQCRFKINLIVNKDGEYFGFGYIRVSCPEIYWMILGYNPNGTERVEEYPDPNWVKPDNKSTNWGDIADNNVHPTIRKILSPLVSIPGYEYDEDQVKHLFDLKNGQESVPKIGFFEISRGYATEAPLGTLKNRLCARNVPDWIPIEAFRSIFSSYSTSKNEDYPEVDFVDSKKAGRIVFITFDPLTKDAPFALLMTKKTLIVHPNDKRQKSTLIFMHAFDNRQ